MQKIDITKPIQPSQLTGIRLDPGSNEPVAQIQVLGTIPFRYLLSKADVEALKRIASMTIEELNKRGNKW
jgi:hypothetical protein